MERINGMASWTDANADTVFKGIGVFILRFVKLKTDCREVIQFGNGVSLNLRLDATFEDAIE